ncbi:transmembrane protein 245 isoform X2 [Apis mellifera]|uniref:Transmembrane protein 245 isoform X2 n=1 Tax=Apis mellifera TaxID=7460 RepID=A0A7M7IFQ0_APIME|nr:transmembrane protein 245 isoform X2 [Apis mellifera]|eukprot:XP_016767868.1 transmembrane protein 245 isoform X2 [Apis mellifera]
MMDSTKSPMDNLFNMLSSFSAGHEKALKQGIYNAVALFLLCLISAAGYGLYIILKPFVKPLIWALLCGSVLFPFKCSLTTIVQSWFEKAEVSHTPLIINLIILPMQIIDKASDSLGSFLWKQMKYIVSAFLLTVLALGIYHYTPTILSCLIWRICLIFNTIFGFFITTCNTFMITFILIGYLSILYIYWTPNNSIHFRYTSFVMWFIISLYISNILGAYQIIVFVTLQILYLIGFIYEVILIMENQELEDKHMTFMEAISFALTNNLTTDIQQSSFSSSFKNEKLIKDINEESIDNKTSTDKKTEYQEIKTKFSKKSISLDTNNRTIMSHKLQSSNSMSLRDRYLLRRLKTELRISIDIENDKVDTDKYMYGTLYACIGMLFWKHRWMIYILIIPIAFYIIKQLSSYFGLWKMIENQYNIIKQIIKTWCIKRHQALLPANIRGLYKFGIIIDEKLTKILKASVDSVVTIAVIFGLLIFTTCTSIFITIQVYTEGMHLIHITGEILNSSLMNNPDIDWLPEHWEDSVNSVLDNAYTYGRSAISDGIKGLVRDLDATKADQMEKKVLELWDRLYQAWMMSNVDSDLIGPTVDVTVAYSVWESFKESFGKTPLQLFNMTGIQNFIKENIGIFMSVLDSIWNIVKGNMSVILTIFTELFYIILMSGTAVFNFVLSMVVFFTTLFYLLSSSEKTYKPIELTTIFSPISCHRFAVALQEAVIGVFTATFKLACFFGMWTWFIHNLFQVKIIYLPSTFATILGAVPFLDAYFACIPATIELWFNRGPMIAILFFMFHFLPCNIVVTEFYKEIKGGGHPYLTGLSIAGGIFCLGVEGVIFGPLLLCCIMVAINLSRRYLHSPSEEVISTYAEIKH